MKKLPPSGIVAVTPVSSVSSKVPVREIDVSVVYSWHGLVVREARPSIGARGKFSRRTFEDDSTLVT